MKESTYKFKGISKENKGITLIALIITIVVMLILVGVTVRFTIGENGILSQTKEAKKEYEIGQVKEIFSSNYSLEYYQKTGYWPSDEAITKIAEASIETGIDVNKFIVYHDEYAIKQNEENKENAEYVKLPEEYVFYNWSKVTLEEMEKLEVEYEPTQAESNTLCNLTNRCFSIDADGDGYLTKGDIAELDKISSSDNNLIFEHEKHDLLAKVCFDTNQNDAVYNVITEYWGVQVGFNEGVMFLWQITPYLMEDDPIGYTVSIDNSEGINLLIGKMESFNNIYSKHIYYNSGRVPLE